MQIDVSTKRTAESSNDLTLLELVRVKEFDSFLGSLIAVTMSNQFHFLRIACAASQDLASDIEELTLIPEAIIAPKVGPIRATASNSESSIPPVMNPGTTSRVLLTMASSARFMSSPRTVQRDVN